MSQSPSFSQPTLIDDVVVILDASTLINLANGEVLVDVLTLDGFEFLVGEEVMDETSSVTEAIRQAVSAGVLQLVDDNMISARAFFEAKQVMHLGSGETECILAAEILGCRMACDDLLARRAAKSRLGQEERVTGSLGLLRELCSAGKISIERAYAAYQLMVERGGYLPEVGVEWFAPRPG